ncbi:LacI family DNA-binding transcriptional regulator [Enterococcus faecalis]|uniref:LacI family DNA-binding transcriptional regulator n=1 Tax=Enterococcus faecalis TaxID=1351 RepID=UPI0030917ECA|nr:hypothetical protein L6D_11890 [Enterococcus faecalis]
MTTIREIARLSGSSVTTVSRVINHHPYVSEEKRLKIQAIIDELGYKPNILARNLSFGKSNTLGVMVPYTNQPYFDAILSGIIHQAFQQGMMVSLLPTDYDKEVEKSYLEKMATGTGLTQANVWTALAQENIGANLQHYNPVIDEAVAAEWSIPANWNLRAQMVIGSIEAPAGEKEYMEDSARFKEFN